MSPPAVHRILILGGGFGGVYTARNLEKIFCKNPAVEITLLSAENYFLMTPLLFEAGSGVLEPRHAVNPLRLMFKKVRFVEGRVEKIDFDNRQVTAWHPTAAHLYELPYDQLVLALGGITNRNQIPGSQHALAFKTLGDAIFLRNHIIDLFERADVESDPEIRRQLLTIILIGGGLVGVELMGELSEFTANLVRHYPRIPKDMIQFVLIEANPRILPELEPDQSAYADKVLRNRRVQIITNTRVSAIEPHGIRLPQNGVDTFIPSQTILLTAGVAANPLLADLPLAKSHNGRLPVEPTLRSKERPEVWAIGDCALIPDPHGNPYPPLAQHALREARTLARNIAAVIQSNNQNPPLEPFIYKTLGMLASLGHYKGVGRIMKLKIRGFAAWWAWRTYYLFQTPRLERKLRIMLDWTVALLFRNDAVKLDLFGEEHPTRKQSQSAEPPPQHNGHSAPAQEPLQPAESIH